MAVDLEEAFARDCCWLPRRATFYLSTVWGSGAIGAASLVTGLLVADAKTQAREKAQDPVLGLELLGCGHDANAWRFYPKSPLFSD
jgi:hypothetical protein